MTLRALAGLAGYNLFILGVGAGALWGMRGWRWWTELVRYAGVAYLVGVSALMVLLTLELVLGIPIGSAAIVLTGAAIALAGVAVGRLRHLSAPRVRPPQWRFPRVSFFAALFAAGLVVYFEGLFRASRLASIPREWDSWAFWIPKAKELYLSGHLDPEFLAQIGQPPSYPPGLIAIHAGAFHAMGSADTVTLHVQHWFLAVGFAGAVVGLLAARVHQAILFPSLLAFLVAPYFLDWTTTVYADIPLGFLVAVAALLVILWIEENEPWQLAAASVLLAGAMLTKREGILFAACVLLAGCIASFAERRRLWPPLLAAGFIAFACALPWRIWFMTQHLPGDGPDSGYTSLGSHLDRVWPSLRLTVSGLFREDLWHFATVLGVAAIALALVARAWRTSLYAATFTIAALAGGTWVLWSNLGLDLGPDEWTIRRMAGTIVLVLGALTPLLLTQAWSSTVRSRAAAGSASDYLFRPTSLAWLVVLVGVLSHPLSMLSGHAGSGLPGGMGPLGSTVDCAPAPQTAAGQTVLGYAASYAEATAMRRRAEAAGAPRTGMAQDRCGRVEVFIDTATEDGLSNKPESGRRADRVAGNVHRDTQG